MTDNRLMWALSESGQRIIQRTERIAAHGYTFAEALRRSNAAESDPTGPAGVYGFGRCDRCGESFREDDEQAEIAGTSDSPASLLLDNIVIHVGCISDEDVMA